MGLCALPCRLLCSFSPRAHSSPSYVNTVTVGGAGLADTTVAQIEEAFKKLSSREDVAIILINQHVANEIRHVLTDYDKTIPTVLEIPSKDVP